MRFSNIPVSLPIHAFICYLSSLAEQTLSRKGLACETTCCLSIRLSDRKFVNCFLHPRRLTDFALSPSNPWLRSRASECPTLSTRIDIAIELIISGHVVPGLAQLKL